MIKFYIMLLTWFCYLSSGFAQVGIGTTNPRGALDINDTSTGNSPYGLVLPTNLPDAIRNPQGGQIPYGTMIFDSDEKCIKFFRRRTNAWSNCITRSNEPQAVVGKTKNP